MWNIHRLSESNRFKSTVAIHSETLPSSQKEKITVWIIRRIAHQGTFKLKY